MPPGPDDPRDKRRTPHRGVRLPESIPEEFDAEESTGVRMLRTYVDKLAERDEKAHDEIKQQVKGVADDNRAQSQILGEVRDELARTTTATQATSKSVDRLVTYVDSNQKAQLRLSTARGEAEIDDTADLKKKQRAFWFKVVLAILVPLIGAAGVGIEHWLFK